MAETGRLGERRGTKQLKCEEEEAGKTGGEPGEKSRMHILGIAVQRGRRIPPAGRVAAGHSSVQAEAGQGVNEKGRENGTNKIRNDILANRASPGWGKTQRAQWVLFSVLPGDELWAETSPLISFLHLSRAAVPQPGSIQKPLDEPSLLGS